MIQKKNLMVTTLISHGKGIVMLFYFLSWLNYKKCFLYFGQKRTSKFQKYPQTIKKMIQIYP